MAPRFEIESEQFKNLVSDLRRRVERIPLDETHNFEANAELSTIEAQVQSPDPKHNDDALRATPLDRELNEVQRKFSSESQSNGQQELPEEWCPERELNPHGLATGRF